MTMTATTRYHRTQQYSINALTDASGTIVERYAYSAYGVPTITNATGTLRTVSSYDNRYTYTGREWDDDLHLYHYRARMYDADLGRFCSKDPIGSHTWHWGHFRNANYPSGYSVFRRRSVRPSLTSTGYIDGPNSFLYAVDNPTRYLDPAGLRIVRCCAIAPDGNKRLPTYVWVPDGFKADPCGIKVGPRYKECGVPPGDVPGVIDMCNGDPVCEKDLIQLLNLIPEVWVWGFFITEDWFVGFGSRETCKHWQVDFRNKKLKRIGQFRCIRAAQKDFPYTGDWPGWKYHSTIEVCFPSGECVYLDQGWLGGSDHFFDLCDFPDTFDIEPEQPEY